MYLGLLVVAGALLNLLLVDSVGVFGFGRPPRWPEQVAWTVAVSLPLLWRRRFPEVVAVVIAVVFIGAQIRHNPENLAVGASITFGIQIAQSVTEEKQTRIVEILVATVPVRALLAGKVLASSLLAMGQIALIAVVALVSMQVAHAGSLLTLLGPAIGWFVPFFVIGFVMLAALWAVAGALVSRVEEIATSAAPLQMLVILPFFAVVFLGHDKSALTVLSYVPFSAPTAMPIRLFLGQAQPWEPLLPLLILLGTAAASVGLGARLYSSSLLRTGRTKLAVAWRQRSA